MEQDYTAIIKRLKDEGYWVALTQASHVADSLLLSGRQDLDLFHSLRVHKRDQNWHMSLPGPCHYRITQLDRICELCRVLLATAQATGIAPRVNDDIANQYALVELSDIEWSALERDYELRYWGERGWRQLADLDEENIWERLFKIIGFDDGKFIEPHPSATWDVSSLLILDAGSRTQLEADLNNKMLAAFVQCLGVNEELYVLDYRHPCFLFSPHRMKNCPVATKANWAVPILPEDTHHFYLEKDFRFGLLSHLDGTICVFGKQFLAAVETNRPLVFHEPIRNAL